MSNVYWALEECASDGSVGETEFCDHVKSILKQLGSHDEDDDCIGADALWDKLVRCMEQRRCDRKARVREQRRARRELVGEFESQVRATMQEERAAEEEWAACLATAEAVDADDVDFDDDVPAGGGEAAVSAAAAAA
eukprot:gene32113-2799_t